MEKTFDFMKADGRARFVATVVEWVIQEALEHDCASVSSEPGSTIAGVTGRKITIELLNPAA